MNRGELLDLLRAPVVTEKTEALRAGGQYVFRVARAADKRGIKKAVEMAFSVKVRSVRVCNTKAKTRRFGARRGVRPGWKKAYVRLQPGSSIEWTERH